MTTNESELKARYFLRGLSLVSLLAVSACASFPFQELSDARQALEAAQAANASEYAPAEYRKAVELLRESDRFIAEGDYRNARKAAHEAKLTALRARRQAAASDTD
ncbi:MAG TPA: DUF4398 domain-containing protein [Gammaproteobacteria bacterium]|nr:DUF4398 domain-containing protein [Gammaproteobacteria bacterium]